MKQNEALTYYPAANSECGYYIRTYDSFVEFEHRPMFEHKHSDFEISLICCGNGLYQLRDHSCDINAGDVFVFGSNQSHCITDVNHGEQMMLFNVQFEPRLFWSPNSSLLNEKCLKLFNGKCERLRADSEISRKIREHLMELRKETIKQERGYQVRISARLLAVIGDLILHSDISYDNDDSSKTKSQKLLCMDSAMSYINDNLDHVLSLEDIATRAGFSRNYFSTLFTELNGLSPWDYIIIRRIEKSKTLLKNDSISITEIAYSCGYGTLSNFNRQFNRIVGCSPSEYRNKYRNNNNKENKIGI